MLGPPDTRLHHFTPHARGPNGLLHSCMNWLLSLLGFVGMHLLLCSALGVVGLEDRRHTVEGL
jgi:hypothetical protein